MNVVGIHSSYVCDDQTITGLLTVVALMAYS